MRLLHNSASLFAMAAFAKQADAGSQGDVAKEPSGPRQTTIAGQTFEIPTPYTEGHPLTAAEASVLNQTFLENIRNNAAGKIKAAKEAFTKAGGADADFSIDTPLGGEGPDATKTLRQVIADYAGSYVFGVRVSRTSEPADPVQREARSIAREAINAKLKAGNVKRKDVDDAAYEAALATHSQSEAVQTEAKRRVAAMQEIGLEELGLGAKAAA